MIIFTNFFVCLLRKFFFWRWWWLLYLEFFLLSCCCWRHWWVGVIKTKMIIKLILFSFSNLYSLLDDYNQISKLIFCCCCLLSFKIIIIILHHSFLCISFVWSLFQNKPNQPTGWLDIFWFFLFSSFWNDSLSLFVCILKSLIKGFFVFIIIVHWLWLSHYFCCW